MQVKELIKLLKSVSKESEICILLDKNIINQNAEKMNSSIFRVVGIEENDDYVELELDI